MHEMGIALQIIEISQASIPPDIVNPKVERINLKLGRLSAVVADSLRFCFEAAAQDTIFSGVELNIEDIPVVIRCNDCKSETQINEPLFSCGHCGSTSIEMISGRELDIRSIELAEEE